MSKVEAGKVPMKSETVSFKVYIHCEGCRKKVKKIINSVDGVESIAIDAGVGKVTVTGTVDWSALIRKLEKAGKVAELWPNGQGGAGKGAQKKQQQGKESKDGRELKEVKEGKELKMIKDPKEKKERKEGEEVKEWPGADEGKQEIREAEGNEKGESNGGAKDGGNINGGGRGGGGAGAGAGKKGGKKGGGDGGGGGGGKEGGRNVGDSGNMVTANRSVSASMGSLMVQTGGKNTLESAEYATHIFSDENANNCSIM